MQEAIRSSGAEEPDIEILRARVKELEAEVLGLRNAAEAASPLPAGLPPALSAPHLLESIDEGFAVLDSQWRFSYNNRNAEFLLRHAPGTLLGKSVWEEFPDLIGTPTEQALRRAMENRVPETTEIYFAPLAGWFQARIHPVPGGGIFVFFSNVTEQKTAEAALHWREERWRSLANAIPQFVWIARTAGDVQFINDYWYEYTGMPRGDLDDNLTFRAIHPDDQPVIAKMWQEAASTGAQRTFEYRVRRASDGNWRWHLGFHRPERDSSGTVIRWIGSGFEVHDLKIAQESLRETEERQRLAMNAAGVGLWDWDIAAKRVVWSELMYEFYGLSPEAFEGTLEGFRQLVHPDDTARVSASIHALLDAGDGATLEFRIVRPVGEVRRLSVSARVLRDREGRAVRMLGAATDITQRKADESAA